jgi:hypothetical protein
VNPLRAFESIVSSDRCKKFFDVVRDDNKRETRIYPDIALIKAEVKARQAENFDDKVLRHGYRGDFHPARALPVEYVPISESLGMSVTRAKKEVSKEK